MGLSVSAAASIILIASVVAFSTIMDAVFEMEGDLQDARVESEAMASEISGTRVSVIGVDAYGSISMVNEGSVSLDPRHIWLLLNGTVVDPSMLSYEVEGIPDTRFFHPGETMVIHTGTPMNDTCICLMAGNGVKATAVC